MNRLQLAAQERALSSKGYLKSLRRDGKVPGVLHRRHEDSLPVTVDAIDLKKAISTSVGLNVLLDLDIDGVGRELAMIGNLQREILKSDVFVHVDFSRVSMDELLEVHVPVVLVGHDKRDSDDGVVSQPLHEVTIRSAPGSIPESFRVDISGLKIGDSVLMKEIEMPQGCTPVTEPDEMVVSIMAPRLEAEPAESDAEPEAAAAETADAEAAEEKTV